MTQEQWLTLLSLASTAILGIYTIRNARKSTDQASVVSLRGQDMQRIESLEKQVKELWEARRADAAGHAMEMQQKDTAIRERDDHIDVLENHIWRHRPPPPPAKSYAS